MGAYRNMLSNNQNPISKIPYVPKYIAKNKPHDLTDANSLAMVDVDDTAIYGGKFINGEYFQQLKHAGVKKIVLFTNMNILADATAKVSNNEHRTRAELIEAFTARGFEVVGVITSHDLAYRQLNPNCNVFEFYDKYKSFYKESKSVLYLANQIADKLRENEYQDRDINQIVDDTITFDDIIKKILPTVNAQLESINQNPIEEDVIDEKVKNNIKEIVKQITDLAAISVVHNNVIAERMREVDPAVDGSKKLMMKELLPKINDLNCHNVFYLDDNEKYLEGVAEEVEAHNQAQRNNGHKELKFIPIWVGEAKNKPDDWHKMDEHKKWIPIVLAVVAVVAATVLTGGIAGLLGVPVIPALLATIGIGGAVKVATTSLAIGATVTTAKITASVIAASVAKVVGGTVLAAVGAITAFFGIKKTIAKKTAKPKLEQPQVLARIFKQSDDAKSIGVMPTVNNVTAIAPPLTLASPQVDNMAVSNDTNNNDRRFCRNFF